MECKIGVINYNFPDFSLEDLFIWCRKVNCEYVELQRRDVWNEDEEPEKTAENVAKTMEKYGVKVSQISSGNDFLQKTEEDFNRQVEIVKKLCKIIKIFGGNQLRIDGGWEKEGVEEKDYKNLIIKGVKTCTEYAEKEGVYLALDNHGTVTNNYELQLEIFETIKSKNLGANLDTMNYRWYGYPVEELLKIYTAIAPYALHTHMKDGTGSRENYKGAALGEGEIPLKQAVEIIKKTGYQGVWCAEYEGPEKENGTGYGKCVNWLKNNLGQ